MAGADESATDRIEVELLGRFRVAGRDGTPIEITSRRGRALVAYLAANLDQSVPRSRIAGLLWEERTERSGRHNLRQVLSELREALGDELQGTNKDTVRFSSTEFSVDVVKFVQLSRTGAVPDLEAAVALYRGELTTDLDAGTEAFEEWSSTERRRLHGMALDVFDACVRALEADNRQAEALSICERLLVLDPIREATHRLLIALEASVNGRSSALNRAEQLAADLREQVGVSPEPATIELVASLTSNGAAERKRANSARATDTQSRPAFLHPRPGRILLPAGLALGVIAVFAVALWQTGVLTRPPSVEREVGTSSQDRGLYRIAVMPFELRADEIRLQNFSRSLEQDLVDSIAHVPRFQIISYQTSRSYRGTEKDAREIGKELDIDFLLTGNANLEGDAVVVRTQLVDARSGQLVSSEIYNHDFDSTVQVFDEIVLSISRKLQVEAILSEGLRRSIHEQRDAELGDLIQRGTAESIRSFTRKGSTNRALQFFEEALKLRPESIAAKMGIASNLARMVAELQSDDPERDIRRADELLTEAVSAYPDWSSPHYFLGVVRKQQGRMPESVKAFENTLKLNPSHANAHAQLGHSLIFMGRADEAETHIQKAMRLSPKDPIVSAWYLFAGQASLYVGDDLKAIEWLERSVEAYPHSGRTQVFLAAAYALNGENEKAAAAARAVLQQLPRFSPKWLLRQGGGYAEGSFVEQRKRVMGGVEKALALLSGQ